MKYGTTTTKTIPAKESTGLSISLNTNDGRSIAVTGESWRDVWILYENAFITNASVEAWGDFQYPDVFKKGPKE